MRIGILSRSPDQYRISRYVISTIYRYWLGSCSSFSKDRFSTDSLLGDDKTPWQVTAKSLTYKDKGVLVAVGDVVITKGGQSLHAQEAVYNTKTGIAEVSKGFRLESGGDIVTGEQGIFDLENQTGKITKGRLFLSENHFYVSGDVIEKTGEDSYLIKNCKLTTCDGTTPAWSITGSEIRVTVEGYGTVKHAAFRVRKTPILYGFSGLLFETSP